MAVVEGLPMSVQVRLVSHAKATGMDPNLVLQRFATERFLYRLSRSQYADRFVLKGALLLLVWLGRRSAPQGCRSAWLRRSVGAVARANLQGTVQHRC